jgi:type IV pilus assembly protein PilQ
MNQRGEAIGSLQELGLGTDLSLQNVASVLNFGVLTNNIDWSGIVQAEVRNSNGRLHSNPVVVTMENKPARIAIAQEVPYIEFKQTDQGGSATNTEFKEIGTILEVTPRVTHDNDILVSVYVKESDTRGELNGVPIEDVREAESELRTENGQTIFIGGLRKNDHDTSIRKVPILGDVPVFNVMFRQNTRTEEINELMVFMTNTVLDEKLPELDKYQEMKYQGAVEMPLEVNAQSSFLHDMIHPNEIRDPAWKFRRSE